MDDQKKTIQSQKRSGRAPTLWLLFFRYHILRERERERERGRERGRGRGRDRDIEGHRELCKERQNDREAKKGARDLEKERQKKR